MSDTGLYLICLTNTSIVNMLVVFLVPGMYRIQPEVFLPTNQPTLRFGYQLSEVRCRRHTDPSYILLFVSIQIFNWYQTVKRKMMMMMTQELI